MVQTDVVAVSWQERSILIGECNRGADAVNRQTVRHLLDQPIPKTVAALPEAGQGWRVIPALFARSGATPDAQALMAACWWICRRCTGILGRMQGRRSVPLLSR
jgi:hypothetical protein